MKQIQTIFVTGYAQAPKGTKLFETGSTLGVMLEIDKYTDSIVDADCTFITALARSYFKNVVVGYNFKTNLNEIIQTVEENMLIPSTKSIIVALKIAHQRYIDSIERETD